MYSRASDNLTKHDELLRLLENYVAYLLYSSFVMLKEKGRHTGSKRHFDLILWRHQTFSKWPHQGLKRGAERGSRYLVYVLSWCDFDISVHIIWLSFSHLIFCLSCGGWPFQFFHCFQEQNGKFLRQRFFWSWFLNYHFYFLMIFST